MATTANTHPLVVPGFIYHECLDPACTEFPRENPDIAAPRWRKHGYGHQAVYDLTVEQRETLLDHVRCFGEGVSYGVDDPSVGRRVVRWVDKVEGVQS